MDFSPIVFTLFAGQILIGLLGLAVALVYWIWAKLTGKKMNAKFGVISIFCFLAFTLLLAGLAYSLALLFVGVIAFGKSLSDAKADGFPIVFWLPAVLCFLFIAVSSLAGFISAIASLRKKEIPKGFGYAGLFLNALPALFGALSLLIVIVITVLGGLGFVMKFFGVE